MIDNFSILLSHALIVLMFYLLLNRDDLDVEEPPVPDKDKEGFAAKPSASLKKQKEDRMPTNPMRPIKKTNAEKYRA